MQRKRNPTARNFHLLASLRVEILARHSQRYADADFRYRIGLGALQCRIIGLVGSQGPLDLRRLCVETDMEKTYASRLVAKLAGLGLLQKSSDPRDQRSFTIALTRAGRRTYDRIFRIAFQRNESWLAALSPDQRKNFFACLDILDRASRRLAGSAAKSFASRDSRSVITRTVAGRRADASRMHVDAQPPQRRRNSGTRAAQ
jgi:DNA-binding MarR family transcriptional regulator